MDKKKKSEAALAVVKTLQELGLDEPEAIEVLIMALDGTYSSMLISYEVKQKSFSGMLASLLSLLCDEEDEDDDE